ncbi:hypothetical protein [Thiohalocapsa halophila]|uniref:hypothetical protein n=1 Tax=Thiohalocapsa halophila TaxID=69359 RepID=UPI001908E0EC|nr:hypothetical protein [Thiohalocapsa halophila]
MSAEDQPHLYDWCEDAAIATDGAQIFLIAPISGDESDEVLGNAAAESRQQKLKQDIQKISGADAVYLGPADIGVGASWEAVGALLGFASSILTLAMAAEHYAPRLRRVVHHLGQAYGCKDCTPSIALSSGALEILVAEDIRHRFGLDLTDIRSIQSTTHSSPPVEPRVELSQVYACHNIMVEAIKDSFLHVWSYIVSADGYVITDCLTKVPIPNASHWFDIEPRGRRLIP